jgi:DNA-binding winged helix-turn-helix (wHTH) protein/Tol biopolymer transport system component
MAAPFPLSPKVKFASFELDAAAGQLLKHGVPVRLQPQPFRVLQLLIERRGQVVTREEIQRCIWGESTFVDFERGINFSINRIRAVLSDSSEKPRYIETLPRIGYRFIAEVSGNGAISKETRVQHPSASRRVYEWPPDDRRSFPSQPAERTTPAALFQPDAVSKKWNRTALALAMVLVAVSAVGYGLYTRKSRDSSMSLENIRITKLTDSGKAEDVAISPDGHYVAYLFRDGDDTSLRLRQVEQPGEAQVLIHDALLMPGLTFSPNGDRLYFLRAAPGNTLYRDLFEIPVLGGPERKVGSNVDSTISFSPDGRQFAYERGSRQQSSLEVRIANADGSGDRLLTTLHNVGAFLMQGPAWSPDGTSIAVSAWMLNQQPGNVLDIVSTANGDVRPLYSGDQAIGRPRWLPAGNTLIVPMNDSKGLTQLWTVTYPAGKVRRVTNDLADYSGSIDIDRDGRMLAAIQTNTVANLWINSLPWETAGSKQLTFGEQKIFSIVPLGGGQIAFTNRVNDGLFVMDEDGSRPGLIARVPDTNWFAGCGRFILFQSSQKSTWDLMRIDLDGANALRLSSGMTWAAACSPDGKFVYYAEALKSGSKIRRLSIDGGSPVDIVDNPGDSIAGNVAISPDGQLLAFPYDTSLPQPALKIAIFPIGGGPVIKTFDVAGDSKGYIHGPRWSPDGRSLQYQLEKNGASNLWEQPLAGGPPRQLTSFTTGRIFDFNWTSDGKHLLLSRGEVTSDVVLLSHLR